MARTVRLSPEAEMKNSVIERAVLELHARVMRRDRVRRVFDRVRDRDAELLDGLSR